jgi:hypothetical protein
MNKTAPLLACLAFLLAALNAEARPAHKQALADYFGPYLPKKLNDCVTCHIPDKPDAPKDPLASEKPHNVFGARLADVKSELKKAGKKTDIAARLDAIADEDSDGDGVSNLIEILAGRFPGDANDKPTDAELAEARQKLPEFRKFRASYPWRPFETVKRPAVPQVKNQSWVRNPIDAFIAAEHEERGLKPRPEASKAILLRRVYFDLIGLPPTPAEQHAALADTSADWYEKVVDRLLASPQYGERWGRHWMDVWRYSDWAGWTGGNQIRDSQPHIWRWRDWIIESLNKDKGYDRMVLEMLAADELAPEDSDALRATGYLVRNYKMLSREKWMQDTVDHTFQAFLGVTLGCARCHDHMYDPIHQKEYYRVRAIFEPHQVRTDSLPGQPDTKKDGLVHAYDADLQVPTYFFVRGDDRTPDKSAPIPPGVPEALGGRFPDIEPVKLPNAAYAPEKREFVIRETVAASESAIGKARDAVPPARRLAAVSVAGLLVSEPVSSIARLPALQKPLDVFALADLEAKLAEARHNALVRVLRAEKLEDAGKKDSDEWKQAAAQAGTVQRQLAVLEAKKNLLTAQQAHTAAAEKAKPEAAKKVTAAEQALAKAIEGEKQPPSAAYTPRPIKIYPQTSTGRRLAFARWIADQENPLTARVAMNHMWLRHFGQAIVPRTFDFGRNGQRATHPALLDWLAAEFMERGWSMKAMHKLMVMSNTYRQSSTTDETNVALDRDNKYLWRMPSHRLEAELVRDCIFYVAGKLDLTMGGADIDHNVGLTLPRRSIYFRHAQEKQMEFLKIFDCAAVTECYQRKESVLPQQALALANSELTLKHARLIARMLSGKSQLDDADFIKAAYEQVLARTPTAEEVTECAAFLKEQTQRYAETAKGPAAAPVNENVPAGDPALRARENLVHVLFNHHDFVTVR